jgi:Mg-chelatase subunit ChlD
MDEEGESEEGEMEGGTVGSGDESDDDGEDVDGVSFSVRKMEDNSTYFSRRLKAVLKDNAVHRPSRNKIYGDLSHKTLYKIATTSKIFERKQLDGKKDYYIGLIVDCSGSMGGQKCDVAAHAARTLVKDFQQMTKICVTTFNAKQKLVKKFNEKFDEKRLGELVYEIHRGVHGPNGGDNYDVDALRFMFEQMKTVHMGTRAIIILSDGEPQYENGDGPDTFRETVKMIEKAGIPVLSIGICDDGVSEFYNTYEVVNSVPDLFDAIINMIRKYVIRKG